jgi:hypothetical protein
MSETLACILSTPSLAWYPGTNLVSGATAVPLIITSAAEVMRPVYMRLVAHDHGALLIEIPPQYMECTRCLDLVSLASSY